MKKNLLFFRSKDFVANDVKKEIHSVTFMDCYNMPFFRVELLLF
jgi:hypothetical protein